MEGAPLNKRDRVLRRKSALWLARASYDAHWKEIAEYQQPRLGRFSTSETNQGQKKHTSVIDNTAVRAANTLAAGLMSGISSPARPWFRLAIPDRELMESGPVKEWLHESALTLRRVFAVSNTYRALHMMYLELGLFGTSASVLAPNFERIIHHHPLTAGEYAIALGEDGMANTLMRELRITVGQVVERFGLENCSTRVKTAYQRHAYDDPVDLYHLVQPRHQRDRKAGRVDGRNKRWESLYVEASASEGDQCLEESGYDRFPVLCPRWIVIGTDAYGASPGMEALGDAKQLHHQQLRKGQAIDYQVNPPLTVPERYKGQAMNRLPGGVMYVESTGNTQPIRSAWDVNLRLDHLLEDIMDVRERIRSAYYVDLFLMLANDTRSNVTATEIAMRHEEKLLMLGPVLERLHNELHEPLIDITFDRCMDTGILPPVPPELEGMHIDVEFISVLAQAQRAVATQGMDRMIGVVGQIATLKPDVLDKFDFDQAIDDYAEAYGINPELVIPDDQVAAVRQQRAQQQQAAMAASMVPPAVDAAATASSIDMNNLRDVMGGLQGYSSPSPEYV